MKTSAETVLKSSEKQELTENTVNVDEGKKNTQQVNREVHSSATSACSIFLLPLLSYLPYFAILGKHLVSEMLSSDAKEDLKSMAEIYFSNKGEL